MAVFLRNSLEDDSVFAVSLKLRGVRYCLSALKYEIALTNPSFWPTDPVG